MARLVLRRRLFPANTQKERALAEIHENVGRYKGQCPGCGEKDRAAGVAQEAHTCPYRADVNVDSDTLCICCSECQADCADEV